jgi:CubicO group peptidase (beta-lactamase class C family)
MTKVTIGVSVCVLLSLAQGGSRAESSKRSPPTINTMRCEKRWSTADDQVASKIETYMAPYITMCDFSGVVLVARAGEVLFRKSYGLASFELAVPNTARTRFHIASLTKTFTAAAILLLQKQGALKLDDPLRKFAGDYPGGEKIRIVDLLSHTSGIPDYYSFPDYEDVKSRSFTTTELVDWIKKRPLDFEPGKQSRYSNSGYAVLAYIIEVLSGSSYDEFIRARILNPLNLKDTGTLTDDQIIENRACGYEAGAGPARVSNAPSYSKSLLRGSGSLYSTADDLLTWARAIIAGRLFDLKSLEYPYGWGARKWFNRDVIEQDGSSPGFVAHISVYPKDDVVIILLGNIRSGVVGKAGKDLAAILFGEKYDIPAVRRPVKTRVEQYESYVGKYEIGPGAYVSIKAAGQELYLKGPGGYYLPLEQTAESTFFFKQLYVPVVFEKNKEGRVTQLLWDGNFACKKIE